MLFTNFKLMVFLAIDFTLSSEAWITTLLGLILGVFGNWIFHKIHLRKGTEEALDTETEILNSRIEKSAQLDYNAEWVCEWKANKKALDKKDVWNRREVAIKIENRKITIKDKSADNNHGEEYICECDIHEDHYLFGTWHTKSRKSHGLIWCIISSKSNYMFGQFITLNNSEHTQDIGPIVFAKNDEGMIRAKDKVKDPNALFKSDTPIANERKEYHAYHLSQLEGKNVWRHYLIDFTKSHHNEVLVGFMDSKNKKGTPVSYRVEAGKRGSHFVIFDKQINGNEEPSVWIFPFMFKMGEHDNYGFIIGQNCDGNEYFGKAIISTTPYKNIETMGTVSKEEAAVLEKDWTEFYGSKNNVPSDLLNFDNNHSVNGTDGIYSEVDKYLHNRIDPAEIMEVDILGYTLFSVSPKLIDWFDDGVLKNININLSHLDAGFIELNQDIIHKAWIKNLESHLDSIDDFKNRHSDYMKENNVTINFFPYSHIPVIHGFKISKMVYLMSVASWELPGGFIRMPNKDLFMKIDAKDISRHAIAMRALFDNWLVSIKKRKS